MSSATPIGRACRATLLLVLSLALAGCFLLHRGREAKARPDPLYSPNGEPLSGGKLGDPSCEDALSGWFGRVDAGHVGSISLQEFLADARRQFAAMDLDRDGVITPSVLAQYRAPYNAASQAGAGRDREAEEADDSEGSRHGRGGKGGGDDDESPAAHDEADPVMLADVNLHNRVTLDDFLAYERHNFASLDANHDGGISRDELLQTCKPPK